MWHAEHTLETSASPEALWRRLAEVERWPEWDGELEWAKLQGPLRVGASITVKHRGGDRQTFRLIRVEQGTLLEGGRKGLLMDLKVLHRLEPCELGTRLTRRVTITGLLSGLAHLLWARRYRNEVAESARKLAREASRN